MAWIRQTPEEVDALFSGLRARDPFGHRLHLLVAAAACFLAGFPTTWLEWAWGPAVLVCMVRLISHHRILGPLFWEPAVRLTLAWVIWGAASLAWSAGTRQQWLVEWGVARYALLILALWPVMNERRWLIGALAAGVLAGNLSQAGHAIGKSMGIDALVWPRFEGRNSGWWDPVVGGSILCAALGLHLAGLMFGRSTRERAIGAALSVVTLAAIAATGTRGAWIGAGLTVMAALAFGAWRLWCRRTMGRMPRASMIGLSALLVLVCAVGVWFAAGPTISQRVRETRQELSRAMEGDYATFTGARLAMWGWAGRAFAAHPVQGIGMGGYRDWTTREMALGTKDVRPEGSPLPHSHAHSAAFHAAAATGLVGIGLLAALIAVSIRNGLRGFGQAAASGYDAGPAMALLGLVLAGLFDSIQVNQQTAYWMWALVALCMLRRPRIPAAAAEAGSER